MTSLRYDGAWMGQKQSKHKSGSTDASKAAVLDDAYVIVLGRIP